MQRVEEYEIKEAGYFWIWILSLSPNLIWCGYSVLICSLLAYWLLNITYQMTKLEIVINLRVVILYVLFLYHLESSIWVSVAQVVIQILKYIQSESESKLLHLIRWSSLYPFIRLDLDSVFDVIFGWSLALTTWFIKNWI